MSRTTAKKINVGSTVKVRQGPGATHYIVEKISDDGFACEIAELKQDGGKYSPQHFDTSLLIPV